MNLIAFFAISQFHNFKIYQFQGGVAPAKQRGGQAAG